MIELKHLSKQFDSATPLRDVSVTINKGDAIAVIGPSGTGKSTLLRCINLLERPTSGQIFLDGEEITSPKCDINRVRMKLGMVFQSFNLYEHLTVVENCMLAQTVLLKRPRREACKKAMELLASVGMDKQAMLYPSQLSGGQKQRAAIARTLANDPEIILFDEPTSALDPLTVGEVEEVIARLSKEGRTMMIVTHSMEFARKVSNRVFYMDESGIYEEGTPEQIFEHPRKELTRRFIGELSALDLLIKPETHNFEEETGKIHTFLLKKGVPAQRIINACAAFEETLGIIYRYYPNGDKTVHFVFEYDSVSDSLTCSFVPYFSFDRSEIEQTLADSLEYKLLTHYVKSYKDEHADEGCGVRTVYTL